MTTFGRESTTDDVLDGIDLTGRTAVVTGASTGLGEETSRALASRGAEVILAVRDLDRGSAAADRIRATVPGAMLEVRQVELGSFASVRALAGALLADHDVVHLLINNAGVMACPFATTEDGFELQFGTNHLGHFLLTQQVMPLLVAANGARVISVSSAGHRFGDVDLDDVNFERTPYDPWLAYGRSKTANALFAVALDQRFSAQGVRAFSLHPGAIMTELGRHLTEETFATLAEAAPAETMFFKSVPEGAATSVWAATASELDGCGGLYLEDCHVAEISDDTDVREGVKPYAVDPERADALWVLSERLVGR